MNSRNRLSHPEALTPKPCGSGLSLNTTFFLKKKRYQPLADFAGQQLGVSIQLVPFPGYDTIINNFNVERLDGAFLGSFTGAMALKHLQAIPLARPEYKGGVSTYYGMIFVRKESGIRNGADMQGKRFVFVDKSTTAGYLLPLHYFKAEDIADYHAWFSETYFAGTHEDAIYDVLDKRADIGAAKNTVFFRLAQTDQRLLDDLEILATSPEVPENGLMMRGDIDKPTLTALKECLLAMDKDPKGREALSTFGASRFIETTAADYQPVFDYARDLGLDLAR